MAVKNRHVGTTGKQRWKRLVSAIILAVIVFVAVPMQPVSLMAAKPIETLPSRMQPERSVNDFASLLSAAERSTLEDQIRAFQIRNGTQICIVTVRDTQHREALEYATAIGNSWDIGDARKNNGIVILVVRPDNGGGNMAIAYGSGVERSISPTATEGIIQNAMAPLFRQGRFGEGLQQGVLMLTTLLEESQGRGTSRASNAISTTSAPAEQPKTKSEESAFDGMLKFVLVIGGVLALLIIALAIFAKLAGHTVLEVLRSLGGAKGGSPETPKVPVSSPEVELPPTHTATTRNTFAERFAGGRSGSIAGFDSPASGADQEQGIAGFGNSASNTSDAKKL